VYFLVSKFPITSQYSIPEKTSRLKEVFSLPGFFREFWGKRQGFLIDGELGIVRGQARGRDKKSQKKPKNACSSILT
jgi:hypothetical protein